MKFRTILITLPLLVGSVLPAMAEERSVFGVFEAACLTPEHDRAVMSDVAGTIGAIEEAIPSNLGMVPPLMTVESTARWDSTDSKSKSMGPILLVGAEGEAMAQPATGCLVVGQDGGGKVSTLLDLFDTVKAVDADPGTIGLPYRYWLVDGRVGPAVFAAAHMANPGEGEDARALALVRVAPSVMEQLLEGL